MTTELNEESSVVGTGAIAQPEKPLGKKPERRKPADLAEEVQDIFEDSAYDLVSAVLEGARWNEQAGSWIGGGSDEQHPGWNPLGSRTPSSQRRAWERGKYQRQDAVKYYYSVPFARRDEAKKLGMRFDPTRKSWWSHTNKEQIGPFKRDHSAHGR